MRNLHDEIGHRGRDATYDFIQKRYQWKTMYKDVCDFVRTCEECQRRARIRYEEPLHPTVPTIVWDKIGVDVVFAPWTEDGYGYIVFARDDLSRWIEGKALKEATAKEVAEFIYQDVICRHGCPRKVVVDSGAENKDVAKDLLENYNVKRVSISAYHPQSNGLVERGHDAIKNTLSKYCRGRVNSWHRYLPLTLWADRISVRQSTGYSAFELVYGRSCLLLIEFELSSWSTVDWEEVRTREDLIEARMAQLDEKNLEIAKAARNAENSRKANKAYFDQHKRLRTTNQELRAGDLVLLHNTAIKKTRTRDHVFDSYWRGLYRIREVSEAGFYRLNELDGAQLRASFAGNRLKNSFREQSWINQEAAYTTLSAFKGDPREKIRHLLKKLGMIWN